MKKLLGVLLELIDNTIIITVMHTIIYFAFIAIIYLFIDGSSREESLQIIKKIISSDITKDLYIYLIINAVLIVTLNNLIFRNIFGFITLFITILIYAAIVKFFTGNILLFYDLKSIKKNDMQGYGYLLLFASYIDVIYYIGLARIGRLSTAIIYRTSKD